MTIDPNKTGLVLEGGGMRGVFTAGVLDYLLDRDLRFPYCAAVSAGACNGLSYVSRQRGRAKASNIDLLEKYRYIGMKYLWTHHSIFNLEFMYDKLPNAVLPFDYATYFGSPCTFEMVTTNCRTGQACYLTEQSDRRRLIEVVRASSSLPYVCPIVNIDGEPMLDGGIVDSVPVERAMAQGYPFNVVVLTRNKGYRATSRDVKIPKYIYRNYPRLRVALSRMHRVYNEQLDLIDRLEAEGRILAIRPQRPIEVDRLESDVQKLEALYYEGYECAREALRDVEFSF